MRIIKGTFVPHDRRVGVYFERINGCNGTLYLICIEMWWGFLRIYFDREDV